MNLDLAVAPLTEFRYVHDDRGGGGDRDAGKGEGMLVILVTMVIQANLVFLVKLVNLVIL